MIGDGITDLQAADGGADLFIGYGGVAVRPQVVQGAAWFVRDYSQLSSRLKRPQVAFVGSGTDPDSVIAQGGVGGECLDCARGQMSYNAAGSLQL